MSTPTIKIRVSQADALLVQSCTLTAGMQTLPEVKFSFTEDWTGYGKVAVVRAGSVTKTVSIVSNQITVPYECLENAGVSLIIGVYGTDAAHRIPTVWCACGEILDGTDISSADNVGTATESLVDQMIAYAAAIEGVAETLEDYAIRNVEVNTTGANQYGIATVTLADTGSGDNRTITFHFSNLKGNGIESIEWSPAGSQQGLIRFNTSDGQHTDFNALVEPIQHFNDVTDEAEASALVAEGYALGTQDGEPSETYAESSAFYFASLASDYADSADDAQSAAEDAQEAAEAAQTAAESAQADAEAAATSASGYADAAAASATEASGYAGATASDVVDAGAAKNAAVSAKGLAEDAQSAAESARNSATNSALKAEGFAVGKQDGSSVDVGSQYYQNNAEYFSIQAGNSASGAASSAESASNNASAASTNALKAEGYAVGTQNGSDVSSGSTYYHNNAKYYSDLASADAEDASDYADAAAGSASDAADSATAAAASAADSNSRLYWVTLGTTTVTQITTALSNNLLPVAKYNFTSGGSTYTGTAIYNNTATQTIGSTTYTVHYLYDYHWDKTIQISVSNITGDTLHQTATQLHVKKVNVTQNKTVVYAADHSGDKTIEFDSEPTADSAKLLTSGAVHAAIDSAQDDIEEVIADLEASTTATKNYAVGDLVIVNDILYEVTAAIASGETITSGTNCSATTIEAQLKALDAAKADIDGTYEDMTVGNAGQLVSTIGTEDNEPYNFRTTGGSIDVGERKTMEIVGGTVAWNQLVTTNTNVSKTKSGDIITVNDAIAGNAEDLVVSFEPQQNLHGYDYPWPGGSGKNLGLLAESTKMNSQQSTITYSNNGVRVVSTGNYGRSGYVFEVETGQTYTCSFKAKRVNTIYGIFLNDTAEWGYNYKVFSTTDLTETLSSYSWTFTSTSNVFMFGVYVQSNGSEIDVEDFQLEKGNVATTFVPYSNICPITGFTGCSVNQAKKNLLPQKFYSGFTYNPSVGQKFATTVTDITSTVTKNGDSFTKTGTTWNIPMNMMLEVGNAFVGKTIYLSGTFTGTLNINNGLRSALIVTDKNYIVTRRSGSMNINPPMHVTIQEGDAFVFWYIDSSASGTITLENPQMEIGESASTYESYQGNTYPVSWQSTAGAVYGGTWNPVTGKLIANRVTVFPSSSDNYSDYSSVVVLGGTRPTGVSVASDDIICSHCGRAYAHFSNSGRETIQFDKSIFGVSDVDEFKAYLDAQSSAGTPLQYSYQIETPVEYTLTAQQIALLAGTNNVWNSIGSTQMTYLGTTNEITAQSGHKYLTRVNGSSTVVNGSGQTLSGEKGRDNIFDLTQMFGSSIADYVYTLESGTTGAGVSWFTHLFPKPYYSYNAGQLLSVNTSANITRGFNAWDEQWELGLIDTTTGGNTSSSNNIRSKNYIKILPNTTYYMSVVTSNVASNGAFYDSDKNYISATGSTVDGNFTTPSNAYYMRFYLSAGYGRSYHNDICINLSWDGERDGEYEAYEEHVYPFDESLTLRGVPQLDSGNNLYYDGDTYEADGTVTRKYGIVDLGTITWGVGSSGAHFYVTMSSAKSANCALTICEKFNCRTNLDGGWASLQPNDLALYSGILRIYPSQTYASADAFKSAMSGVYLVYELKTPTTEEADPYQTPQIIDDFGTEEFVDYGVAQSTREVAVPVGHNSIYVPNLRAKLEMAPNSPDGDGDYIVRQSNGENEYVPLVIPNELPDMPTSNGTYTLQATVSGTTKTLSWVSAT